MHLPFTGLDESRGDHARDIERGGFLFEAIRETSSGIIRGAASPASLFTLLHEVKVTEFQ